MSVTLHFAVDLALCLAVGTSAASGIAVHRLRERSGTRRLILPKHVVDRRPAAAKQEHAMIPSQQSNSVTIECGTSSKADARSCAVQSEQDAMRTALVAVAQRGLTRPMRTMLDSLTNTVLHCPAHASGAKRARESEANSDGQQQS